MIGRLKVPRMSRLATVVIFGACVASVAELPESLLTMPPEKAGAILAEHLRSSVPAEKTEFNGELTIRHGGNSKVIPIVFRVEPGKPKWRAIYETRAAKDVATERLAVVHTPGELNQYIYSVGDKPPAPLSASEAFLPFAGSDFWLVDLGLDFFHWPSQRVLKGEVRKNIYAYVLESKLPIAASNGYSRVVSWIDRESGAPLQAEAYDRNGQLLKLFEIERLRKVEGQWRLRSMRIRDRQKNSLTRIEFDFAD